MSDHHHDHHGHGHHHSPVVNATVKAATMVVQALTEAITTTVAPPVAVQGHQHHVMDHTTKSTMDMNMDHNGHMDMGHMGMDMDGNKTGGMDHMMMYFHTGNSETILFKEWKVETTGGMVGAVIAVLLLAILYEGLKFLREQLYRQQYTRLSYTTCAVTGNSCPQGQLPDGQPEMHRIAQTRILNWSHLLQTSLHVTQVLLSYFLMLIFMTFNVWLCLGVLIGSGVGFFLFGWRKSTIVDISDHCHQ